MPGVPECAPAGQKEGWALNTGSMILTTAMPRLLAASAAAGLLAAALIRMFFRPGVDHMKTAGRSHRHRR